MFQSSQPTQKFLSTLLLSSLVAGCSGGGGSGGGGSPPAPTGNLTTAAVRMDTADPNAGHEVQLTTTIAANEEFRDVPVGFVLLNREDVDSQAEEVRQHVLGSAVFDTVPAGETELMSIVVIPEELRDAEEWYLIANVDPSNVIPETDEEDNMPTAASRVPVQIRNTNTDLADLVIENVEIDADAAILEPRSTKPAVGEILDVEDHDFSATLVLTTTGVRTIDGVDVSATLTIPGGAEFPLNIWDEATETYIPEVLTDVAPSIPNTVHLDFVVPAGAAREAVTAYLRTNGSSAFPVALTVNRNANVAEWENGVQRHTARSTSDNAITGEIVIMLPPEPDPQCNDLRWNDAYKKNWNNSVFSIGVDFNAGASLDERGAIVQARAAVPVALLGSRGTALDMRTFGRVSPQESGAADSQFDLDVDVFGVSVFSRSSTDPEFRLEETLSFTRSQEQRVRFFAGPIPLELRAVGTGTVGFTANAVFTPARIEVAASASGNIEAIAEAAVSLIIVRVGIGGSIRLLEDEFTARGSCSLTQPSNGQLTGTLQFDITNDLRGPSGRLFLFEEHPEIVWCWTIFPCGFRQVRNEYTLASFRTFRKVDVLYNDTRTATVCLNQRL